MLSKNSLSNTNQCIRRITTKDFKAMWVVVLSYGTWITHQKVGNGDGWDRAQGV